MDRGACRRFRSRAGRLRSLSWRRSGRLGRGFAPVTPAVAAIRPHWRTGRERRRPRQGDRQAALRGRRSVGLGAIGLRGTRDIPKHAARCTSFLLEERLRAVEDISRLRKEEARVAGWTTAVPQSLCPEAFRRSGFLRRSHLQTGSKGPHELRNRSSAATHRFSFAVQNAKGPGVTSQAREAFNSSITAAETQVPAEARERVQAVAEPLPVACHRYPPWARLSYRSSGTCRRLWSTSFSSL